MIATNKLSELRDFWTVGVRFRNLDGTMNTEGKVYTYKSNVQVEVGEEVVILDPSNKTQIVSVVSVEKYAAVPTNNNIKYKWIVSKVELARYHEFVEQEEEMAQELMSILAEAKRSKLQTSLLDEVAGTSAEVRLRKFFQMEEPVEEPIAEEPVAEEPVAEAKI